MYRAGQHRAQPEATASAQCFCLFRSVPGYAGDANRNSQTLTAEAVFLRNDCDYNCTVFRLSAHRRALYHAHAVGRLQVQAVPCVGHLFLACENPSGSGRRTYSVLHVTRAGYFFFVSSTNPQLLSQYQ